MTLTRTLLGAVTLAVSLAGASAADPLRIGHTINPAPAPIFLADQQGLFTAAGLDLGLTVMTADPLVPAALLSGSLELSTLSPTTFLAAVSNGLDLVAFSGTSVTTAQSRDVALVVGAGSGIQTPQDLAGRTIGVPGLGALLDVMVRAWLTGHGVDPASVTFIEVPFPQHAAQITAGRIDAAMTAGQFAGPMVADGSARVLSYPVTELPEGLPTLIVAATREWAEANAAAIATFRSVMAQSQALAGEQPDLVRAALAQAMQLPPPVAERITLPTIDVALTVEGLRFWHDAMRAQGRLGQDLDLSGLVLP